MKTTTMSLNISPTILFPEKRMKTFDLIVIGAGSGLDVVVEAANNGLTVALIEEGPLGGTCLNRGCIPSKMILHAADVAEEIRGAARFGIRTSRPYIDFKSVTRRATKLVDHDAQEIERSLRSGKNPQLFQGRCFFIGERTLQVGKETIRGEKIVIAAGARPAIPLIPGLDTVPYVTSTEALRITKRPKSMIIIGGGYIGAELGYFYAAMGCAVTILQRNKLLIPNVDTDIAERFTTLWKKKYNVLTSADVKSVQKKGKQVVVTVAANGKAKNIAADALLIATGRKPNSDLLQVEKTGVKTKPSGHIVINGFLETTANNIWALGDIASQYQFKHSANLEAEYVLRAILGKRERIDYHPMPYAIFTYPQVAGVGMTEQEAIAAGKKYVIGKYYYKDTGMGAAMGVTEGFVKFIIDTKTWEILGCHILGPDASVLIHEVVVAMKADRKKALRILQEAVHVHPALSEVVQRAARSVGGYHKA